MPKPASACASELCVIPGGGDEHFLYLLFPFFHHLEVGLKVQQVLLLKFVLLVVLLALTWAVRSFFVRWVLVTEEQNRTR